MPKKRKRGRWILLIVLAVVAAGAFLLLRGSQTAAGRYTEQTVANGSIETHYSFSGNIAVRDSQSIAAKVNATVRELYADEDQSVRGGDPLLRLSTGDIVKADIDGEVTKVHVSVGDTVSVGTALVDIVNFDNLQVLINVDEFDVAAVTAGKEATVTIDALGMSYESEIEHISKQAQASVTSSMSMGGSAGSGNEVTYYEAKLSAPKDDRILPGMKVDVRILNEYVEDVPVLSMSALQFDAYNQPYVLMRDGDRDVKQVPIGVGVQDGTSVQITSGLSEGDVVLVPVQTLMFPMMGRNL